MNCELTYLEVDVYDLKMENKYVREQYRFVFNASEPATDKQFFIYAYRSEGARVLSGLKSKIVEMKFINRLGQGKIFLVSFTPGFELPKK